MFAFSSLYLCSKLWAFLNFDLHSSQTQISFSFHFLKDFLFTYKILRFNYFAGIGLIITGTDIIGGEVGAEVGKGMRVAGIEAGNEITVTEAGAVVRAHMVEVVVGVTMRMKVQSVIVPVAGVDMMLNAGRVEVDLLKGIVLAITHS